MTFTKKFHRWNIVALMALLLSVACGPASLEANSTPTSEESGLGVDNADAATTLSEAQESESAAPAPSEQVVSDRGAPASIAPVNTATAETDAQGIEIGFTEEGHPYRGSADAPVVIEEFSDYQCPFCNRFHSETLPALIENQIAGGEARYVFYDFPLSNIHPQAIAAAKAARCAGEQGIVFYWEMNDLIFAGVARWENSNTVAVFEEFAQELDLDMELFQQCQSNEEQLAHVQNDLQLGRERGVNSTPSFFINGQPLVGAQPLSAFNQAISAVQSGEAVASTAPPTQEPAPPQPKPTPATILIDDVAGRLGDEDAPVVIIEFTDYQCPFCQRHNAQTMPALVKTMIETGRAQYLIKDFPLDSIHPEARTAAVAARCAGEQGAYWEMHDAIFSAQDEWAGQGDLAAERLADLAGDLSLDLAAYDECAGSGRYDDIIQTNQDEGLALGVRGTPFFFIDGFPINGAQPFELFEYAIGLAEEGTLADAYVRPTAQAAQPTPEPSEPIDVPISDAYSIGDLEAPVVIVEYTDFQCPFCSRHFQQTMPQIETNFIDKGLVRYVFKDFPLTNIHEQAVLAAEAARCAGDQGAYLEMHDMLFSNQGEWSGRSDADRTFLSYARELSLQESAFTECLNDGRHREAVFADFEEGSALGVRGTPAFFLNGHFLSGAQPYSVFEQAINRLLSD